MRKFTLAIAALILAAFSAAGFAQVANTPFSSPTYYATSFNLWSINSQNPNTYIFPGRTVCNSMGQNVPFFVFATTAPVYIADSNTANSEIATPSAVVNTAGSCGVTMAPSHTHNSFQLRSGTAGLQESINAVSASGGIPSLILLDRNWWSLSNNLPGTQGSTIIGAAAGGYGAILEDLTTAPATFYVWTGTAYSSTAAFWQNTAPTPAAGAAAGSGPTIANANGATALSGVVNLTTGTATTSGTLFTLTYPTNNSSTGVGSFQNAGTCSVNSVGANSFTTFTVATSFTSSHRLVTVTVTATPTASTAYAFSYNCK